MGADLGVEAFWRRELTHNSHHIDWETTRCSRCNLWAHAPEAEMECVAVEKETAGVDYFAANRDFSA